MEKELESKIDFLCNKKYKSLEHCLEWIGRKFKGCTLTIGYVNDYFAKNMTLVKIEKEQNIIYLEFLGNKNELKLHSLLERKGLKKVITKKI